MISVIIPEEGAVKGVKFDSSALIVPDNLVLSKPIIYTIKRNSSLSIHIGNGSDVLIREKIDCAEDSKISVSLSSGSNCSIKFNSTNSSGGFVVDVSRKIFVGDDSRIEAVYAKTGCRENNEERTVELAGRASKCYEYDVFFGNNEQKFRTVSNISNIGEETCAESHVHGVLDQKAFASCIGNMKVPKGAIGAESELSQHVLLLTRGAKAEVYPNLEIEENNVRKAAHGATVRPLSPEHIFYLKSRGLSDEEARKILVSGFLTPFLDSINRDFAAEIVGLIGRKLEEADVVSGD